MGRPAKGPKERLIEVPCKVAPDVHAEIARLAITTDRSHSQIARKLISRGLAAYRRDGSLDEPSEIINELPPNMPTTEPIPTERVNEYLKKRLRLGEPLSSAARKKGGKK